MDSQVVVEVVELPEELGAARVVAFQDLLVAIGLRAPILDDPEIPRARGHPSLAILSHGIPHFLKKKLAELRVGEVFPTLEHNLGGADWNLRTQKLVLNVAQRQVRPRTTMTANINADVSVRRFYVYVETCVFSVRFPAVTTSVTVTSSGG